jgi:transcriptional regulator with XRE-family HTH domain
LVKRSRGVPAASACFSIRAGFGECAETTAMVAFAAQLRAWRKRNGWTQAQLAQRLVCSESLVGNIEIMNRRPTADFARACDAVFSTPATFETFHGAPKGGGCAGRLLGLAVLLTRAQSWIASMMSRRVGPDRGTFETRPSLPARWRGAMLTSAWGQNWIVASMVSRRGAWALADLRFVAIWQESPVIMVLRQPGHGARRRWARSRPR